MPMASKGQCLCGSVKFTLQLLQSAVHVCHCGMCRKWGAGGPAITADCTNVAFDVDEGLAWYDSSEWAQRGFCQRCGSSLFYRMKDESVTYMNVSVAVLERSDDIVIQDHIYVDHKPPYYDFADNCPRLTEKETLEKFEKELSQ